MKRIGLTLCIAIFSFGMGHAYASVGFLSDTETQSTGTEKKSLFETKSKLDETGFQEDESESSDKSLFFDFSDDDNKLYAPPPGEPGNPQKIAPLGNSDIFMFLILSLFSLGYFYRRIRKNE